MTLTEFTLRPARVDEAVALGDVMRRPSNHTATTTTSWPG